MNRRPRNGSKGKAAHELQALNKSPDHKQRIYARVELVGPVCETAWVRGAIEKAKVGLGNQQAIAHEGGGFGTVEEGQADLGLTHALVKLVNPVIQSIGVGRAAQEAVVETGYEGGIADWYAPASNLKRDLRERELVRIGGAGYLDGY